MFICGRIDISTNYTTQSILFGIKMFRIKNNDQNDHSMLHQSETVRKKSQLVKIAELIGSSKKSQNDQIKSTVKTITLPERLTPYLKSASSKKRNDSTAKSNLPEKLTPYLKSASNKKKNETETHVSRSKKNVRRNLNFTKIPSITTTTDCETASTTSKNNLHNNPKEGNVHLSTRKSFLLPPNTIKDSYVKNRQSKSILSQSCILTAHSVCNNKYFRISEKSKTCPSIVKDTNVQIDSCMNSIIHKEVNQTVMQHLSSQMFSLKSEINSLHSNHTDIKNNTIGEKISENLINVNENECLPVTDNYKKHLHESTQSDQMINESCLDLKSISNKTDEFVNIDKIQLTVLASKLKNDIVRLEEDIIPNLKLIFTDITNVLSRLNITTKEIDNSNIDDNILEQIVENLNNIEIMNTNRKSLAMISNNINIEDNYIPEEVNKTPDTNLMKSVEINGKNNSGIHSCQIDLFSESNKENDSFVNLENKLDITNIKSSTIISLQKYTPVLNKYSDKKVEKPLREYMALKSRMSCLLTPNIKRFSCSQSNSNNLHSEFGDAKACLSGKILAELYNLYED